MGFNTDADKFWRILTWSLVLGAMVGATWWACTCSTPDLPFAAWLADASRNDVWGFLFGCIVSGVAAGRLITSK
jgi:hypothetical protein